VFYPPLRLFAGEVARRSCAVTEGAQSGGLGASSMGPWIDRSLAVAAGAATALAHPPWGLTPCLLGFGLMLWLIDRTNSARPLRSAFLRGWLAGAGYFAISLMWLAEPFQIDAAEQGWMAPFAVVIVALGMALFWAAAALVYRAFAGRGPLRVVLFAGCLAGAEWLRGHVLTGFPWDLPGEAWRAGSAPSQAASLVGAYGLTWLTIAAVATVALVQEWRRGWMVMIGGAATLIALFVFGAARLAHPPLAAPGGPTPTLRIVQADVPQESKYDQRRFAGIVGRYVTLTARPSARPADIVIWPEGAVPAALEDYLAPGTWTRQAVMGALAPGQTLLVGGYRWSGDGRPIAYNSLAAFRRTSNDLVPAGLYDKYRLVPFGEFMPLDSLASRLGIKQFVHVGDGFASGPPPRPLAIAGIPPVQPLICYESLFPGLAREGRAPRGVRARWIVNVSNDAWFGSGSGPRQHLNLASYRAIEEGLPMVRATPTGISAVIDAFGRVPAGEELGHGVLGVIDAPLPPAAGPTLYSRLGDWPFLIMLILSLAGARWPRRKPTEV